MAPRNNHRQQTANPAYVCTCYPEPSLFPLLRSLNIPTQRSVRLVALCQRGTDHYHFCRDSNRGKRSLKRLQPALLPGRIDAVTVSHVFHCDGGDGAEHPLSLVVVVVVVVVVVASHAAISSTA